MTTMQRVGTTLRAIAARVCSAEVMARVVDPLIADLQAEHGEALEQGRRWKARWIRVSAGIAFVKVMAYCGGARMITAATSSAVVGGIDAATTATDGRVIGRTLAYSGIASALWMGVFMLAVWQNIPSVASGKWFVITILSIPQAVPLAVPIGFAVGLVVALGGRALSSRARRLVLLLALAGTVVSFTMMAWGIAAANTAFQRAVFERDVKGVSELTLFEMRERAWPSADVTVAREPVYGRHDRGFLELSYYTRWALSFGTLVLGVLALTVRHRGRVVRTGVVLVGGVAYIYSYYFMTSLLTQDIPLPAMAMAWLPNVVIVAAAGAMLVVRSRRAT